MPSLYIFSISELFFSSFSLMNITQMRKLFNKLWTRYCIKLCFIKGTIWLSVHFFFHFIILIDFYLMIQINHYVLILDTTCFYLCFFFLLFKQEAGVLVKGKRNEKGDLKHKIQWWNQFTNRIFAQWKWSNWGVAKRIRYVFSCLKENLLQDRSHPGP